MSLQPTHCAIPVKNAEEFRQGVKYFQSQGYTEQSLWCYYSHDTTHVIIDYHGKINHADAGYVQREKLTILDLFGKEEMATTQYTGHSAYMPTTKRFAIQVANEQEFNSAVKYFEKLGYKQFVDCEYNGNYTKYVAIDSHNEICGSSGIFVFNDCLPVYQLADLLKKEKKMSETYTCNYAIEVVNQQEFNSAVKYFERMGYRKCDSCSYGIYGTKYVVINQSHKIDGSNGAYVIGENLSICKLPDLLKGKDPEMKKTLKAGDIVTIHDWSWNINIVDGQRKCVLGRADLDSKKWKVIECGAHAWPIDGSSTVPNRTNNMVCCAVDNTSDILFISSEYANLWEEPIRIGGNEVKFFSDGSIKVGCTSVDNTTVNKIINRIKGE